MKHKQFSDEGNWMLLIFGFNQGDILFIEVCDKSMLICFGGSGGFISPLPPYLQLIQTTTTSELFGPIK